ncbi:MAG: C-terminal helicase domain-containing protein, partial [Pseudomonadota bacterium]
VARQATTNKNITQGVLAFKASRRDREGTEKRNVLRALIDGEGEKCTNAIIFCNRKTDVDIVAKSLKKYGYDAAPIHGDLDQSQRTRTLDGFREGSLRFLVASDVAARGLDVPSVSHVFNYDVPSHAEDYVHRIGRTGRAGRDGTAIMICVPRDEKNLEDVERLVQHPIPRLENPFGAPAPEATAEPSAKAETVPAVEEKPKRSRGGRGRGRKAETDAEATPEARTETEQPDLADARKDDRRDDRKDTRKDGRGRRRDRRDGPPDKKVVGLGDHTPEFIELSFADRVAS